MLVYKTNKQTNYFWKLEIWRLENTIFGHCADIGFEAKNHFGNV